VAKIFHQMDGVGFADKSYRFFTNKDTPQSNDRPFSGN